MPEIDALGEQCGMSRDQALAELKKRYDGYHFAKASEGMYNPYSLLNTFAKQDFADYWYETGTPTFLVKAVKNLQLDIRGFDNDVTVNARNIDTYQPLTGGLSWPSSGKKVVGARRAVPLRHR